MKTGFCVFAFLLIFLAPIPAAAAGKVEALDADKDGKTDSWLQYDKEGSLKATVTGISTAELTAAGSCSGIRINA